MKARLFAIALAGLSLLPASPGSAQAPAVVPAPAAPAVSPAADPFGGAAVNLEEFRYAEGGGFSAQKIAAWNAAHTDAERVNIRNGCTLVRGAVGTGRYGDDLLAFCNTYVSLFWQVFIVASYVLTAVVIAAFLAYTLTSGRRVRQRLAELEARGVRRRSAAAT